MPQYRPTLEEFKQLARQGNTVPVYCQLLGDHLTPVTAFWALSAGSEHAFLLESVVSGEKIARYSFLAADPQWTFEARGPKVTLAGPSGVIQQECSDPLTRLADLLASYRAVHLPDLPPFTGGAVGYAGYDMVRYYEPLPNAPPDDRNLADLLFAIYDTLVAFDHVNKTILIISHAHVEQDGIDRGYEKAVARVETVFKRLAAPQQTRVGRIQRQGDPSLPFESNFERPEDFHHAVEACKEYIRAGDIFQVVLSQRLRVETTAHPFDVYRALRVVNPSPYMFYLKSPRVILVGSSPEIMCRVQDGVITNRPLAGTRRRGKTEEEDKALQDELLADPKERAEHIMLVDLGRNDVGRVAELGTVELADVMAIERYSHVMHISSTVKGRLAPHNTSFDALRATLPVGTVSGAPKVRAMQIIDEFEPTRRGPYAGAVGYIDFAGNMDTCIALRTMVVTPGPLFGKSSVFVQVGAGIVADSQPHLEYQETINKAKSMLRAIEIAQTDFE